jgi:hypothetical protein
MYPGCLDPELGTFPSTPSKCYRARMAQTLGIRAYDADGALVKDFEGSFDEEPEFYAHQLLHADGIVCVEISVPDGETETGSRLVLRQCDPEVNV